MAGVLTFLIVTLFSCQIVHAARIEITPTKFSGLIPTAVNISCVPGSNTGCSREIVVIQILKDEALLTSLRQDARIVHGTELTKYFQVEGHIDSEFENSFLRLSMQHLMNLDSAKYTCVVYYIDDMGIVDEERDENYLNLNDVDLQPHVKYLFNKMNIQEDLNKDQARKLKEQELQLKSLEIQLKDKDTEAVKRIDMLENATRKQSTALFDLIEKDSHVSFFMAGYTRKDAFKVGDLIIFDSPVKSKGQGFDKKTGLFTAPTKGIYMFQLTTMTYYNERLYVDIQVNKRVVARTLSFKSNYHDQSNANCVVELESGDVVRTVVNNVRPNGIKMYSFPYSLFTGCLIKAL